MRSNSSFISFAVRMELLVEEADRLEDLLAVAAEWTFLQVGDEELHVSNRVAGKVEKRVDEILVVVLRNLKIERLARMKTTIGRNLVTVVTKGWQELTSVGIFFFQTYTSPTATFTLVIILTAYSGGVLDPFGLSLFE
ncbi:hypothetical protein RJ641_014197 [Dillenia turbinata]|uniref:Uncharacterized protein n=1 Tax=Dillenia turbinata TaxID=194707 RepID=A0AAN8YZ52_9MAGN